MTNQELERRLARAVAQCAPDDAEGILSRCKEQKGTVICMKKHKNRPAVRTLAAACLAVALLGGGAAYRQAYAVTSVVSLDVNPSIELEVNRNETVLSCTAINQEAAAVLADMGSGADLKGTKLDVAVNAIVGALVRNGYLDQISSAILISVEDSDQSRAAKLQQELTSSVDGVLQKQEARAAVLSQTVRKDAALEEEAEKNGISTGKAALIRLVMAQNNALTFEALANLSVEELNDLAESGAPALPIGKAEALRLAKHAVSVTEADIRRSDVDVELDDVVAHYDVELDTVSGEYEVRVDAYSGKILWQETDRAERAPAENKPQASERPVGKEEHAAKPAEKPAEKQQQAGKIDADSAKAAALAHAGLQETQVTKLRVDADRDDGRLEYEVEFRADGVEYEYTVDAETGRILEHERDRDD